MVLTRINGKYNIMAKNENPSEFAQELLQAAMLIKEDMSNETDDGYDYIGIMPLVEVEK